MNVFAEENLTFPSISHEASHPERLDNLEKTRYKNKHLGNRYNNNGGTCLVCERFFNRFSFCSCLKCGIESCHSCSISFNFFGSHLKVCTNCHPFLVKRTINDGFKSLVSEKIKVSFWLGIQYSGFA